MDYEVFLLSRIREEYLLSGNNAAAVADGLASTARVITAAACIMIAVFASFVLGDVGVVKLMGVGLTTAIFVDATIVRMVLVRRPWSSSAMRTGGCPAGSIVAFRASAWRRRV